MCIRDRRITNIVEQLNRFSEGDRGIIIQVNEKNEIGFLQSYLNVICLLYTSKPAVITIVIINTLPVWNDFFNPLLFISSESKRTLPIAIYSFVKQNGAADYGSIFAVSVISIIFPILLFLCFQEQFYKGMASGAVKGLSLIHISRFNSNIRYFEIKT